MLHKLHLLSTATTLTICVEANEIIPIWAIWPDSTRPVGKTRQLHQASTGEDLRLCDLSVPTVGQIQSVSTAIAPLDYWILHCYGCKQDAATHTFWDAQSAGQLLPSSVSFTSAESVEPSARKLRTRTLLRNMKWTSWDIWEWAQNGLLQVVWNFMKLNCWQTPSTHECALGCLG